MPRPPPAEESNPSPTQADESLTSPALGESGAVAPKGTVAHSGDQDVAVGANGNAPRNAEKKASTLTLKKATVRIGPKILQALEEKFNGSLAELRAPDEKDQLFS